MKYIYIALIWTAYCALHSYFISISFTRWLSHWLKRYYAFYRLFYVIISILLIIPVLHYSGIWADERTVDNKSISFIIRNVLSVFSLLLFFKAFFFDYDSLSFFGIRQALSFKKEQNSSTGEIKKKGLLGVVRHPMYFALLIILWCQTFTLSDIVANSVLTIYIFIGTVLEERKLVMEFGDQYLRYKQEVPMLFPFLKLKRKQNRKTTIF